MWLRENVFRGATSLLCTSNMKLDYLLQASHTIICVAHILPHKKAHKHITLKILCRTHHHEPTPPVQSTSLYPHHTMNQPIPTPPHTPQPKGLNLPQLPTTNGNNNGNHDPTTSTIGNTIPHDNLHNTPLFIYNLHPTTSTTHRDFLLPYTTPTRQTITHTPLRTPSEPPKATTVGDPPPKATTVLDPPPGYNHNSHDHSTAEPPQHLHPPHYSHPPTTHVVN